MPTSFSTHLSDNTKEVTIEINLRGLVSLKCIEPVDCQGYLVHEKHPLFFPMPLLRGDCASSVIGTIYLRWKNVHGSTILLDCTGEFVTMISEYL